MKIHLPMLIAGLAFSCQAQDDKRAGILFYNVGKSDGYHRQSRKDR